MRGSARPSTTLAPMRSGVASDRSIARSGWDSALSTKRASSGRAGTRGTETGREDWTGDSAGSGFGSMAQGYHFALQSLTARSVREAEGPQHLVAGALGARDR